MSMIIERFRSDGSTPRAFEAVRAIPEHPLERLAPGVQCLVALDAGKPVARLSLHLREDLVGAPGRSGLVGHYEALDRDAGVVLLTEACRTLVDEGAVRVLGPMNGSSWDRYRLAIVDEPGDPSPSPPFFPGEPANPPDYPRHFEAVGFHVVARYESRIDGLERDAPDAADVAARVAEAGISIRPLDVARFGAELDMLFAVSLEAFSGNAFYSPIGRVAFHALYEPLLGIMDPDFVLVAVERGGRACGFLFAYTDATREREGQPRCLIAKTVAVAPDARGHGVAKHLLDRVRSAARGRGYVELVHALMHVTNLSTRLSARHDSRIFRRYALWEWTP